MPPRPSGGESARPRADGPPPIPVPARPKGGAPWPRSPGSAPDWRSSPRGGFPAGYLWRAGGRGPPGVPDRSSAATRANRARSAGPLPDAPAPRPVGSAAASGQADNGRRGRGARRSGPRDRLPGPPPHPWPRRDCCPGSRSPEPSPPAESRSTGASRPRRPVPPPQRVPAASSSAGRGSRRRSEAVPRRPGESTAGSPAADTGR